MMRFLFFFLFPNFIFQTDMLYILTDQRKQAHINIGDKNQRKTGYQVTAPIGKKQLVLCDE